MSNLEFYVTAAQVLPAITIGIILQRWALATAHGISLVHSSGKQVEIRSSGLIVLFMVFGLGESSAMLAVFLWPPPVWISGFLPWLTWISLGILALALVPMGSTRVRFRGRR